jgi:hypothetical protein
VPSAFAHALVGASLAPALHRRSRPAWLPVVLASLAAAPDLDVLAFRLGIPWVTAASPTRSCSRPSSARSRCSPGGVRSPVMPVWVGGPAILIMLILASGQRTSDGKEDSA